MGKRILLNAVIALSSRKEIRDSQYRPVGTCSTDFRLPIFVANLPEGDDTASLPGSVADDPAFPANVEILHIHLFNSANLILALSRFFFILG